MMVTSQLAVVPVVLLMVIVVLVVTADIIPILFQPNGIGSI